MKPLEGPFGRVIGFEEAVEFERFWGRLWLEDAELGPEEGGGRIVIAPNEWLGGWVDGGVGE
jgi:hypothetical protein